MCLQSCAEVQDSHGLRLVKSVSTRRHWARQARFGTMAVLVIHICMVTFTVTVNLESFVRIAQRLRDDVCVCSDAQVCGWVRPSKVRSSV